MSSRGGQPWRLHWRACPAGRLYVMVQQSGNMAALRQRLLDTSVEQLRVFPGLIFRKCYLIPLPIFQAGDCSSGPAWLSSSQPHVMTKANLMRQFLLPISVTGNLLHLACLLLMGQVPGGQCWEGSSYRSPWRCCHLHHGPASMLLPSQHRALRV